MFESWMDELETPCIVIDMDQARKNIRQMQKLANECGCALRPHIKTHKMPLFARLQVENGAQGITCAKVSEAEIMADGGLDDIFIAYPMVGAHRIRRAIALNKRIKRLILAVDSLESAQQLNDAAQAEQTCLEVRLEIDTGAGRTGVERERAVALAQSIAAMPGLRLTGIYTFKGLTLQGQPCADAAQAAREEAEWLAETAQGIRDAGIDITDISGGSTPTGVEVAKTGLVTEIRPGTYIFNDKLLCAEGWCTEESIAAKYCVTVVSVSSDGYAVIDGGSKTFSCDIPIGTEPYHFPGYAIPIDRPDLRLARINEEHGMLVSNEGATGLKVGEKLFLWPIHVCTAINLQNQVYLLENGKLRKVRVDARGMLV